MSVIILSDEVVKTVNNPKSSKTITTVLSEGQIHTIYMGACTPYPRPIWPSLTY
jgi:hypothetical protein